jgi:hypothetical protein
MKPQKSTSSGRNSARIKFSSVR